MYELPEDKIATRPLDNRSDSKLLVYRNGAMRDMSFSDIVNEIPGNALIVRNISKVIPARIIVNGGEVFLTRPISSDYSSELAKTHNSSWNCIVRNTRKTLGTHILDTSLGAISVHAEKTENDFTVNFEWRSQATFAEMLDAIGQMPLPPYMNRSAEAEDAERYQTVFAEREGSVAAPTASLHFTPEIIDQLEVKGCEFADVVLHVGLGTFLPMKAQPTEHVMHGEQFEVSPETIQALYRAQAENRPIVCIGTTAFRVVESLAWAYRWYDPNIHNQVVPQWIWRADALSSVSGELEKGLEALIEWGVSIQGVTSIMCVPGYIPQLCTGLITNFHQPDSTLIQLVAAFVGDDWRVIYDHALAHNYRFLSYGDTSLLWREGSDSCPNLV